MVLALIQNVAVVVMLATMQRYGARELHRYPRIGLLASGVLSGSAAIVGMLTPFEFAPGVFYDGRSIIMSLAGLFGGPVVALTAAVIAGAFRFHLGGPGVLAGIVTIITSGGLGVGLYYLRRSRPRTMRNIDLVLFGLIVHVAMLTVQYFLVPDGAGAEVVRTIGPVVITLFPLGTALAARLIIEGDERDETRAQLARESERLRLAMSAADEGTWEYAAATDTVELSVEAARLMRLDGAPREMTASGLLEVVHPDDRAAVERQLESLRQPGTFDAQAYYRSLPDDGGSRWLQSIGTVVEHDSVGVPTRVLGILVDITDTREAADAIERRAIEAELLAYASAKLMRCQDADAVFGVIHEFFAATFPLDIVIVNEIADGGATLVVRDIIGVESTLLGRGETLMGGAVIGRGFPVTPAYSSILQAGRFERVDGGIAEIAAGELPVRVSRALEMLFGFSEFWSLGVADAGKAYAGIHVLARHTREHMPAGVVESFANLCFVTLARIETVRQLAESEARFRTLVDSAPEAIFVQTDYRFAYANKAACELYGAATPDQLVGTPVIDRLRSEFQEAGRQRIAGLNEQRMVQAPMQMVHLRLDGSEVDVEVSGAPIVYEGMSGGVVFVRDITESRAAALELQRHRDHLEELVAERTRELRTANANLQRATRAKSAFLARMSHELRTPLNSIIGFSTILGEGMAGPLTDEQLTQIGMINSSGRHLLSIITDMLDLSRVEAGRITVSVSRIDPADIVAEVADVLRPLVIEKGLELRVRVPDAPVLIDSDPGKIKQILLNLGSNAVKATETGYVELAYMERDATTVDFFVADSGCGIRPELLGTIFESFTQGDIPVGEVPAGTGLGLTISREFARLLGGTVGVASEPGIGSTFTLTLPRSDR